MNLHQPLRTNFRLWLACTAVAFVLLGFVHLHSEGVEGKTGPSHFWGMVVFLPTVTEWWRAMAVIGAFAVILAVPSVAFGWVAQAVIVAVRDARRQTAETTGRTPN
jgi:hypothetical protein